MEFKKYTEKVVAKDPVMFLLWDTLLAR